MSYQSDCKEKVDDNFREVIKLLNEEGYEYWLCHGTLLGVVRDQCLIPWDHDIDIAMWARPGLKAEITNLMLSNGYSIKSDSEDYDFQCFSKPGGREVDFNFYRIDKDERVAYTEWFVPRSKLISLLIMFSQGQEYGGGYRFLLAPFAFAAPAFKGLVALLKYFNLACKSAGYTTPAHMLTKFKSVSIDNISVCLPSMAEDVLEFIYGKSWRIPVVDFDWFKDSPSTKISSSRF